MKNKIRWLRISYWAGAIGDFALAVCALVPGIMEVPSYCYPMGLFSAVAFSWGCMLIWADQGRSCFGSGMELTTKLCHCATVRPCPFCYG